MSVILETTLGDITIDLYLKERPQASLNFLKLCKIKYFNYNLFHTISRGFIAQTGDPTGSRNGGESIFGVTAGPLKQYFEAETNPRLKHTTMGLVSFVGINDKMIGSQFFITLGSELTYLDGQHCIFGEVVEGLDVLELLNEIICDQDNRPYQDVRITHTVILEDPFPDLDGLCLPSRSPSPNAERLQGGRIAPDEEIDETQGKSVEEVNEIIAAKEAKARATILEMIGDIPDAEMAPPENVLFVCKLNPVTTDDDLEIIFSRFGKIKSCEVIRDKKTAESLQYAFVEFADRKACEDAYFKMDNVLIDDRRIHVDFSQSVAKIKWYGKGKGVRTYDDEEKKFSNAFSKDKKGHNDVSGSRRKIYNKSLDNGRHSKNYKHNEKNDHIHNREYHRQNQSRERSYPQNSNHQYSTKDYHTYERYSSKYYKNSDKVERRKDDNTSYSSRNSREDSKYNEKAHTSNSYRRSVIKDKSKYKNQNFQEPYERNKRKLEQKSKIKKYNTSSSSDSESSIKEYNKKKNRSKKKSYNSSSEDS